MGERILSRSFHMVSHIKKNSKLHKNGKPGNKKLRLSMQKKSLSTQNVEKWMGGGGIQFGC